MNRKLYFALRGCRPVADARNLRIALQKPMSFMLSLMQRQGHGRGLPTHEPTFHGSD